MRSTGHQGSRYALLFKFMTTAAAATLALLTAGCSSVEHSSAGADCAWQLSYGNHSYVLPDTGPTVEGLRHQGAALGRGSFPGCNDGGGKESAQMVSVYRITGVDPTVAVITEDDQVGVSDAQHLPASVQALLTPRSAPATS